MSATFDIVTCRDISVSYSRWGQTVDALTGVSLRVPDGQWLMVVGANGSGKSTLLRVLSGLAIPDTGEVFIGGAAFAKLTPTERARRVFQVHQNPLKGTAPSLTVFENLVIADSEAVVRRLSRGRLVSKYCTLLDPVGLAHRLGQPVSTLSGGERQLLALLIAGLRPAEVLLLDEPTAALDPTRAEQCLRLIEDFSHRGKTILHVTHDMRQAGELGHRTVALQGGRLVADLGQGERGSEVIRALWIEHGEAAAYD